MRTLRSQVKLSTTKVALAFKTSVVFDARFLADVNQ